MRPPPLRAIAATLALAAACSPDASSSPGMPAPYLVDAHFRREALVASLVNPANGYSRRRLAAYDTGDAADWSRLPEWNPRVDVVASRELDQAGGARAGAGLGQDAHALAISPAAAAGDEAALLALGEEAFWRYPVQLETSVDLAAASRAAFAGYGFWIDEARGAGGLVRAELPSGDRSFAFTCATCHAASRAGAIVVGLGNDALDLGRLLTDVAVRDGLVPANAAAWLTWGPGRIDVTTNDGIEPVRIADLRPVRWLTHLHADGSVRQLDINALAIRIETLIVTSQNVTVRPPRAVALGLAAYVRSLADGLPPLPVLARSTRGAAVFEASCARCHALPSLTGPPVPLDVAGTDPAIGRSPDRGTGAYRVPSLRGVASRGALLHDASVPSVAALLDPTRLDATFAEGRHGPGAIPGHAFGLDLDAASRADLVDYLSRL